MYNNFIKNVSEKFDINKTDKILLAISGGADSVVMLHLFSQAKYTCGVAHCNFRLRGDDSYKDAELVKQLAENYHFPFHTTEFDTRKYATQNGISIEMAARNLRYQWFEEIRQLHDYKYIAIAHHKDDIIETFFINLSRSTGIRGLSGIKAKNGAIIRPLLFANRKDILNYISYNNLSYREDITNRDTTIIRNKIRHEILPLLQELNPAVNENIITTIHNLQATELIANEKIAEIKDTLESIDNEVISIRIEDIFNLDVNKVFLYEILKQYNFNASQTADIYNSLLGESGKRFVSKTHQLIKDRNSLIISALVGKESILFINEQDTIIDLPQNRSIELSRLERNQNYKFPAQPHIAALDYSKLKYPLEIRQWQSGDYFYPLGMQKKKKVSDFFINEKYSIIDKQNALLLVSEGKIVWIIGKRIDDRFKITAATKYILEIKLSY